MKNKSTSYGANKCQCSPIFLFAASAAWTDGLMRGTDVLSYFLQSGPSDILTGSNYCQKKKKLSRVQNCLDTYIETYSKGQNCIRDETACTWLAYTFELSLTCIDCRQYHLCSPRDSCAFANNFRLKYQQKINVRLRVKRLTFDHLMYSEGMKTWTEVSGGVISIFADWQGSNKWCSLVTSTKYFIYPPYTPRWYFLIDIDRLTLYFNQPISFIPLVSWFDEDCWLF